MTFRGRAILLAAAANFGVGWGGEGRQGAGGKKGKGIV